jgi:uncharacterized protein YdeI (YjbR/CyaY-like superfamily)
MSITIIADSQTHKLPNDLKGALMANKKALDAWNTITPLARNEWICWTVTVKQQKTRDEHVKRAVKELSEGKRRPCCWIGCVHRKDKAMSRSQKFILGKKK